MLTYPTRAAPPGSRRAARQRVERLSWVLRELTRRSTRVWDASRSNYFLRLPPRPWPTSSTFRSPDSTTIWFGTELSQALLYRREIQQQRTGEAIGRRGGPKAPTRQYPSNSTSHYTISLDTSGWPEAPTTTAALRNFTSTLPIILPVWTGDTRSSAW